MYGIVVVVKQKNKLLVLQYYLGNYLAFFFTFSYFSLDSTMQPPLRASSLYFYVGHVFFRYHISRKRRGGCWGGVTNKRYTTQSGNLIRFLI